MALHIEIVVDQSPYGDVSAEAYHHSAFDLQAKT
jgi:hypothetical protein